MKRYAVSYINFFYNNLQTVIVDGECEMNALFKGVIEICELGEGVSGFEDCSNLEDAKNLAFDADSAIDVVEIL